MKKLLLFTLLAVVAINLVSCSRYSLVNSKVLNNSDMTKYRTFSLQPLETKNLPKGVKLDDAQVLYYEITKCLESRNYLKVETGGDMTVYLSVSMKKSVESSTDFMATGVNPNWGGRYNAMGPVPYTHGVYAGTSTTTSEVVVNGFLMMDLVDNKTNNHIFYSEISTRLNGREHLIHDNDQMAKAMDKLLKKLPYSGDKVNK